MDTQARRGGYAGPDGWVFELSGGSLCLDFANTVDNRPTNARRDLLKDYNDLIAWSEQTGLLRAEDARELAARVQERPGEARRILERARTLRDALFEIFSSIARGQLPPPPSLRLLESEMPHAFAEPRLHRDDRRYTLRWESRASGFERMLPAVVRSSVELLTSPDVSRVRICASEACDWLFLDRSRNRTRQWCDMTVCGNRAKARRHYERRKTGSAS